MNPIYYYEHPFSVPRGGFLKTGWTWKDSVCFCHHSDVLNLFKSNEVNREFSLVTEAADMSFHDNGVNDNIDVGFPHQPSIYSIPRSLIPKTLKTWFSTNVNLKDPAFDNGKIECCPIGIYDGYRNNFIPTRVIEDRTSREKEFLCLMNFAINNRRERAELFNAGRNCNWITLAQNTNLSYGDVLNDISLSKFVICPISNGIETSRIWECVYLGAIPIVVDTFWARNFYDLPILRMSSWNEISKEFLEAAWEKYLEKKAANVYSYNKADANYWNGKIEKLNG